MSLYVCLSARMSQRQQPLVRTSQNLLCVMSLDVARSFSGGVIIRYVLPVLWTVLCFVVMDAAVWRRDAIAAASLQCRVCANAPAAAAAAAAAWRLVLS